MITNFNLISREKSNFVCFYFMFFLITFKGSTNLLWWPIDIKLLALIFVLIYMRFNQ